MRLPPRLGITRMNRTLSAVLAVMLAGSGTPAIAQEVVQAPSRQAFTQEALRRAASAAMRETAQPGPATPKAAAAPATGPNRSWDTLVDTVEKGRKVTLTLMTMTNVEGKLLAIDAQSIRIEQPGGAQAIEAAVLYAIFFGLPVGAIGGAVMPIGPPLYEAKAVVRKTP